MQKVPLREQRAAEILHSKFPSITRAKIFDRDRKVVDALRENGIRNVIVAVPNFEVNNLADDMDFSNKIVEDDIEPQIKKGLSLTVAISHEHFSDWNNNYNINAEKMERTHRKLRTSLQARPRSRSLKITVPFHFRIAKNSYPPSYCEFGTDWTNGLKSLTALLYEDGSTLDIKIYPFFAYKPGDLSLPYALGGGAIDLGGVMYKSLLHAQATAVRAALLRLDSHFTDSGLPIVVGETGWPTAGQTSSKVDNAARYLKNSVASGIPIYLSRPSISRRSAATVGPALAEKKSRISLASLRKREYSSLA